MKVRKPYNNKYIVVWINLIICLHLYKTNVINIVYNIITVKETINGGKLYE